MSASAEHTTPARVVPVVFSTDDNYAKFCAAAVQSVLDHASEGQEYHIYILHASLSTENINKLEGMSQGNALIRCRDVSALVEEKTMYARGPYPQEMYYRVLIPDLFPQYDKVIYLDCDVIAERDLAELLNLDLGLCVVGAVRDNADRLCKNFIRKHLNMDPKRYFNSGVLLINCREFEKQGMKLRCFDILNAQRDFWFPDQDALNLACAGNVYYLESQWNYQWCQPLLWRQGDEQKWERGQGILHYTSENKPWNCVSGAISLPFWRCAMRTPFAKEIAAHFEENAGDRVEPYFLKTSWANACRTRSISIPSFLLVSCRALRSFF